MLKTFAEDLKSLREEKNLSLRDISNKTRISISTLENIENGDYSFQPQAYIRAFLKQYLAAMDADVEEILFDYDLARSGKYKSKRPGKTPSALENSRREDQTVVKDAKINISEKQKDLTETPRKKDEESNKEMHSEEKADHDISRSVSGNDNMNAKKIESNNTMNLNTERKAVPNFFSTKNSISLKFLSTPVFRNIFLIIFLLLVLLGLYSLINIIFFEGSNGKPEVIRQNFDDVVKEQESKFLGKRTPEEIQDSIRKMAGMQTSTIDSITLNIISIEPGVVFLVTDSLNFNKPLKIEYKKNETGIYKAGRTFHISTSNTGGFKATINNNPIKFNNKSISKVRITKDGINK
ncbi:MAG: helix-turn-helix transcriptional regulator [Ignavibacteria bacterium]